MPRGARSAASAPARGGNAAPFPLDEPLRSAATPTTAIPAAHGQAQSPRKNHKHAANKNAPAATPVARHERVTSNAISTAGKNPSGRPSIHAVSPLNPNTIAVASVSALRRTNSRAPPASTIRKPDTVPAANVVPSEYSHVPPGGHHDRPELHAMPSSRERAVAHSSSPTIDGRPAAASATSTAMTASFTPRRQPTRSPTARPWG